MKGYRKFGGWSCLEIIQYLVLLMKIFMNLQCMKSINLFLKTDKRHCMPHLYIHATLYSTYRLVVPYFGNDREDPILMTFLFLKLSKSACWAKRLYETAKRNNLSMQQSAVAPNWWNTGIKAAMYTDPFYRQWFVLLTHFSYLLEQNDCVHLPSKMIHP